MAENKENSWSRLSKEAKRQQRVKNYLYPPSGFKFRDARAEKLYKQRANRILTASLCQKPDRVPVSLPIGNYPAYYAGYDYKKIMYDYPASRQAALKFMQDFYEDMDSYMGLFAFSGRAMDIMDYKNYAWPGHGTGDSVSTFQYIEAQYMRPDEYEEYLRDPSDFWMRVLKPRTSGALEPLKHLPPLSSFAGIPFELEAAFARPEVRGAFKKLIEAGEELEKQQKEMGPFFMECLAAGFPMARGGSGLAPFDLIADVFRGTTGISHDLYRQPEKVLETIDDITRKIIPRLINNVNNKGGFSVMFPLHKGDDKFMSRPQFEKFYWPSLKKIVDALIAEGIMVTLFAEGSYNQRLDYLGDFPKGWVTWLFDRTDMAQAKKLVGQTCCISGNVPASIVTTGTPQQVKDRCRQLIETCAPGGGYILAGGCQATEARNPENFRVFMQAAVEYGTY